MLAEINHYLSDDEAFKLDTVSVRLVKTRGSITSEESLSSPDAVVRALAKEMSDYDREVIGVINFNAKMQPINVNFVSAGTLNYSVAHPREILKSAILSNASSICKKNLKSFNIVLISGNGMPKLWNFPPNLK